MGACYSVTVKVKLTNLKDAEERLQKKILQDSKTDYDIENMLRAESELINLMI